MARKNPVAEAEVEVGRRLRSFRERSHLMQTQFALLLGIGRERLASYEAGRVPLPFRIGEQVCRQWGVNPFWLAEGVMPQLKQYFFSISEEVRRNNLSFRDQLNLALQQGPATYAKKERAAESSSTPLATGIAVLPSTGPLPSKAEEPEGYFSPSVARVAVDRLEHDPFARRECIAQYGEQCQVCGIQLKKIYGKIGAKLIEIHRQLPIDQTGAAIDPIHSLIPLCPTCHRMIHLRSPMYSVKELRRMLDRISARRRATPENNFEVLYELKSRSPDNSPREETSVNSPV